MSAHVQTCQLSLARLARFAEQHNWVGPHDGEGVENFPHNPAPQPTGKYMVHVRKGLNKKQKELLELRFAAFLANAGPAHEPTARPPLEFFAESARALIEMFGNWKAPSADEQHLYFTSVRGAALAWWYRRAKNTGANARATCDARVT
ncbi:hypothetical protein B0H12DRAFT_1075225 [Mycena haematopus]|nr:hypothetical protein B0H12DRAFT_1075225 [Mycena haematopus]